MFELRSGSLCGNVLTMSGNNYAQSPDFTLDLHGYSRNEALRALSGMLHVHEGELVRIVIGKGIHSADGPVIPDVVKGFLATHNLSYRPAKLADGGAGALLVQL